MAFPTDMANDLALEEARKECGIPWVVERQLGPFVKSDFFQFGDVFIHFPTCDRRDRIVNSCGEDVQTHIDKYLKGYAVERMRKNKETGKAEIVLKEFPPNPHLPTLALKYDLFLYSFVLRKFKKVDGKRSDQDRYQCRKWKYILSPTGQGSFEQEDAHDQNPVSA